MPPLPSTIQEETSTLIETLTRRQKDLQEFQLPRLRSYKGTIAIQQQYTAELREDLDLFTRNVNTLEALADDQERQRDRIEVTHRAQQFAQSLEQMRKDTRAALLASKRGVESLAQSNRDELLLSTALSDSKSSNEKSGDSLMNASNDVTETLRRTIGLMQGELERSVLSSQMLEQSSASLRSATTTHDAISTLLSTSKHLITALEKSDWLDRLLILAAVAFFFLVVLFILKQRVFDKSLRVAFWWTRFLPDFRGDASMLKPERGETATFLATAAATTLSTVGPLVATVVTKQRPDPPDPIIDDTLSTFLRPDSVIESAQGSPETVHESFYSTISSHADPPLSTSDQLQDNASIQHHEL